MVSLTKFLFLNEFLIYAIASSINSIFTSKRVRTDEFEMSAELMESLVSGAEMAFGYCQQNFKWDRWNCPESAFSRRGDEPATRETAYVLAVTSAAVVHSVARSCSRGKPAKTCGCTAKPGHLPHTSKDNGNSNDSAFAADSEATWHWSGCQDHLKNGEKVAAAVLDGLERENGGPRTAVNRRNNAAGRFTIVSSVRRQCRCHGVSGSCSLQTCWLQAAPFSQVAAALREEYKHAVRVDATHRHNSAAADTMVADDFNNLTPSPNRLVYFIDSPDYCKPNKTNGWPGTRGRACSRDKNASTHERRSCKNLCRSCGHRIRRERREIISRCNCTFKWCCEVKCDTCKETVQEFFCE